MDQSPNRPGLLGDVKCGIDGIGVGDVGRNEAGTQFGCGVISAAVVARPKPDPPPVTTAEIPSICILPFLRTPR